MSAPAISNPMRAAAALADRALGDLLGQRRTACVVTGGAKGIGAAVARRFVELGAGVVVIDADAGAASTQADELKVLAGEQGHVRAAVADVRDGSALLDAARSNLPDDAARLVWVNSAGIYPSHRLDALTEDEWRRVLGINLDGTFHGAKAAVAIGAELGIAGVIVNISSVAGSRAGYPPGIAHYVSSKHGVEGLTKALAVELGPAGWRVFAVAPGTVVTEGLIERFGSASGGADDPYLKMASRMPIRRPALPDDIARVIALLASDAAAMVTGCTVPIDGGQLAS